MFEAEFWAALAFVVFVGALMYLGVHRMVLDALDARRGQIKAELDDARRLREEAEKLLAEYRHRRQEAQNEADAIIAGAQAEAERLAIEAKAKMEDFIARRSKQAETKIAQAETQALADVRAAAAEAAVAAAEKILAKATTGTVAENLVAQAIEDVKKKLD
jgi:F-type H+-transporting ATPase subunit b